jgi:ATP-dependent DNA helicase RecG
MFKGKTMTLNLNESQNTEFKQIWKDEYLKQICGFANAFFKAGYIESWGRGISKIIEGSTQYSGIMPTISITSGFDIVFYAKQHTHLTPQVTPQVKNMLKILKGDMARDEIMSALGLNDRKNFREVYLNPAIADELVALTIPDKPTSSKQKYRLTELGKSVISDR